MIPVVVLLLFVVLILYFIYVEIKASKKSSDGILKKMFIRLDGILKASPTDTGWSSNRFVFIISNVLADVITWGGVLALFIITDKFPDIPDGLLWLYALAKGLTAASKIAQKPFDNTLTDSIAQNDLEQTTTKKEILND